MIYVLLGLILVLTILIIRLESCLRRLLKGKDAQNLEDTIHDLSKSVSRLTVFQKESTEYLKNIEARLKRSVQSVETIRFNPFKGSGDGGDQSFATVLLSENGDGAIISSLYARDRVSVFSKPINRFIAQYELTEEEKEAIKKAQESLAYETKIK